MYATKGVENYFKLDSYHVLLYEKQRERVSSWLFEFLN